MGYGDTALPNGGTVTRHDEPPNLPARATRAGPLDFDIAADGVRLHLTLPERDPLAATATAAGALLADSVPASLVLLLAAVALRDALPGERTIAILQRSASRLLPPHIAQVVPSVPLGELRSFVREAINAGPQAGSVDAALKVAAGRWNAARTILLYGEELWRVRGEAAAWWGSSAIGDDPTDAIVAMLLHIATIALQPATSPISVPLADGVPGEAIIDYLAIASGPDPIPADINDRGLGAVLPIDAVFLRDAAGDRAIATAQAIELSRLAQSLLHRTDRPAPRYLGKALTVALPPDLLPRLGAFGVVGMRVYPRASGLYVAVTDRENQTIAAAWWSASAESGERNPNTFSPACWLLTHVVCAALWHDLCADAVEISAPPRHANRPATTPRRERPERTSRLAVLPPPRYVRAEWGEGADAERIRQIAHYRSGDYRRLPGGYEEREAERGFQARQREAGVRAQQHGYPEPPPGYTFVSPHIRGAGDEEANAATSVRVRSRGLFALMLGVAQQKS